MNDNLLLDNGPRDPKRNFYKVPAKILMLAGLLYAAYLFFSYFLLQKQQNPLLPDYTLGMVYESYAMKGSVLLTGISIAQIALIFRKHMIACFLLLLTLVITISGVYYLI